MRGLLTPTQFFTLAALLKHPMHQYAIRQDIIETSGLHAWPGNSSIKRATISLLKAGYIEESHSDPNYWLKARRGSVYELTPRGFKRLERELMVYLELLKDARATLQDHHTLKTAPPWLTHFINNPLLSPGRLEQIEAHNDIAAHNNISPEL